MCIRSANAGIWKHGLVAALMLVCADLLVLPDQVLAQSQKLVSNLGETFESITSQIVGTDNVSQHSRSQAFTTGNGTATVTSVQIDIRVTRGPTYNPRVSIYTDASGSPGTIVGTALTDPTTKIDGLNTFTHSGINLAASTTYHVVIEATNNGFGVRYTSSDNEDSDGTSGWTIAGRHRHRLDALSWLSQSNVLRIRVDGTWTPGSSATGAPAITGTPQVGQTLTAGIGTIADADGLTTKTFPGDYTFQWIRVDGRTETDISGATSDTYTLTAAEEGKKVKVKVRFTDDGGSDERPLKSGAFPSGTSTIVSASAQDPDGKVLLETQLTVAEYPGSTYTKWGCSGSTYCADGMDENTFESTDDEGLARSFEITTLSLTYTTTKRYILSLDFRTTRLSNYELANLVLELDERKFRFDGADVSNCQSQRWHDVPERWSNGDVVQVRIPDRDTDEKGSGCNPRASVRSAKATEGRDENLKFVVNLYPASNTQVTVDYQTSDGTATAGSDYTTASGKLTFAPGETTKTVSVDIEDDSVEDNGEAVNFTLSNASGAVFDDSTAVGTIRDPEESSSPLTAEFQQVPESHDGTNIFTIRIAFTEELANGSGRKLRRALSMSGGAVAPPVLRVGEARDLYVVKIEPSGTDDVIISLGPTTDCTADDALCTSGGTALTGTVTETVDGPPQNLVLQPNVPNPFNPSTQIAYQIPDAGHVSLAIYNTLGQRVRVLVQDSQAPGRYRVTWDGKDMQGREVSSGVYIYRLAHARGVITRRLLLVK